MRWIPGTFPITFAIALLGLNGALTHADPKQVNIKVYNSPGKTDTVQAARIRQDSLALLKARQDSLSLANKAQQDSLAMAENARLDSQGLADARRRLDEERSKRTEMEKQLLTSGLLVLDAVYFETAKTDISINSKPYLDMLARMLTKYPKLKIEVAGHTDNVGSEAYNMNLSQGRSDAVLSYLTAQAPELSGRLTARGYGESRSKADNRTAQGRELNRRTELQVLNKEALKEYNEPAQAGQAGQAAAAPAED